ncbi:hypothetical protein [Solimonas marina]|uniref:Uncharacterized protein n=1 Tax=Solimonas marina TaxID=2714601 RepID=A0A969W9Q5_9GAMM|nr:hypothetical protein [Solimonas marina]NKF23351.1 hypothetical protein [Solimonas marina]
MKSTFFIFAIFYLALAAVAIRLYFRSVRPGGNLHVRYLAASPTNQKLLRWGLLGAIFFFSLSGLHSLYLMLFVVK